jgi:phospholipid/cholesterol/gamma-HCH transport system ATP-binding protein
LAVESGQSWVFVGPSGGGKSVLLKVIAGLVEPSAGSIRFAGVERSRATPQERARQRLSMGMLFQRNALFDSLTVAENVAFPLREVAGLPEDRIRDEVAFFLAAVGLSHAADLFPDEISGGMQKRLGMARALALQPEIILYDDPTAGLDPITSRRIVDLILDLRRQRGTTILAVTNDMNRAFQMADRIAVVFGGGMVVTGTPEETRSHSDPAVRQFISGALEGPLTRPT